MARTVRSKEDRIAEIDAKIEMLQKRIESDKSKIAILNEKKEQIKNPKPRKGRPGMAAVIKKAKESGLTIEEIAEKLGVTL